MNEQKEVYTTVVEGQVLTPAYTEDGERVNALQPTKVKVMGTATEIDLWLVIISILNYMEQYYLIPQEKSKIAIEQIQRLIEDSAEDSLNIP